MLLYFIEFLHFYLDCPLHPSLTSAITKQINKGGKLSAFQWNKEGVKMEKKDTKNEKPLCKCKALYDTVFCLPAYTD